MLNAVIALFEFFVWCLEGAVGFCRWCVRMLRRRKPTPRVRDLMPTVSVSSDPIDYSKSVGFRTVEDYENAFGRRWSPDDADRPRPGRRRRMRRG